MDTDGGGAHYASRPGARFRYQGRGERPFYHGRGRGYYEHTDEDGNTVKTAEDIVFKFPGGELLGMEQEATLEETSGTLLVEQAEEVINILTGGGSE